MRDGGTVRPNLHATQTGSRRACHASFKRCHRLHPPYHPHAHPHRHAQGRVERVHNDRTGTSSSAHGRTHSRSDLWHPR
eukprot:1550086-Prymnesium_polylepis.1